MSSIITSYEYNKYTSITLCIKPYNLGKKVFISRDGYLLQDDTIYDPNNRQSFLNKQIIFATDIQTLKNHSDWKINRLGDFYNKVLKKNVENEFNDLYNFFKSVDVDLYELNKTNSIVIISNKQLSKITLSKKNAFELPINFYVESIQDIDEVENLHKLNNIKPHLFYQTERTEDNLDIEYQTAIPDDWFYEALYLLPNEDKPHTNIIKGNILSEVKRRLEDWLRKIISVKEEAYYQNNKYIKVIFYTYNFNINQKIDQLNHGYVGNHISNNFRYFIGYIPNKKEIGIIHSSYKPYVLSGKKIERIRNGEVVLLNKYKKYSIIIDKSIKYVEWSEEREDFFQSIEEKFIQLKNNLDNFITSINNDNIDMLIENFNPQKLLN